MKNKYFKTNFCIKLLFILALLTSNIAKGQTITTVAGNGNQGYDGDSYDAVKAELYAPVAACQDDAGNIYLADYLSNCIRKIDVSGIITTIAGTGTIGFSGDGGQATDARLSGPSGIATDHNGNIYIADYHNNRIRKVNAEGIITSIAGSGSGGYSGNGGAATKALLQGPSSVALDNAGNIYFSDCDNNCIRKISRSGIISNFAGTALGFGTGTGSFKGDGGLAANAELNHPKGIAFDAYGNLYFADAFNHRIRKISNLGIISTIAGTGIAGYNKDSIKATQAQISYPYGVSIDALGNILVADHGNNRIRLIANTGTIFTIAGSSTKGDKSAGETPTQWQLNEPTFAIALQGGNILIGDKGNSKVKLITSINAKLITTSIHAQ